MSTQTSSGARLRSSREAGVVADARFVEADSVLYVRFGDGLERAVCWTALPFSRRLGLNPASAAVGAGGESVLLRDMSGEKFDLSGETLRAALDDEYREALISADDRERRDLGARIRTVRERANLSQLELSRRSGIAQESLSRIETGRRDPRLGTLRRLSGGMGLSLEQFLERLGDDLR